MEQKENISYEERMKERRRLITEIDSIELKVKDWNRKIEKIKNKIEILEKELEIIQNEKSQFDRQLRELEAIYNKQINPVGECKGYEILNGLLGMKRDINLKLTEHLDDEQIRQILIIFNKHLYYYNYFLCL
jgi:predicted  nucleic acid-binding Zn-ribbon protein